MVIVLLLITREKSILLTGTMQEGYAQSASQRGSEAGGKLRAIHTRHAKTCEAQIPVTYFVFFFA